MIALAKGKRKEVYVVLPLACTDLCVNGVFSAVSAVNIVSHTFSTAGFRNSAELSYLVRYEVGAFFNCNIR